MALLSWLRDAWQRLDYVPDCPACHGTGEVATKWASFAEQVWWKGRLYVVCHNCHGAGKV